MDYINPEKTSQLLKQHFKILERDLVAEIEAKSKAMCYEKSEILMQSGRHMHHILFILDGLVKVFREDDDGNEFFMYYIKPGQACALSIACSNQTDISQVRAMATKPTIALMVPHQFMEPWMKQYTSWGRFIIETFRYRIEDLLQTFDYVAFRSLDERLEFYLKRISKQLNSRDLYISHQTIANDLNSSREAISRLLKKMEQHGMLEMHREHIVLLDKGLA